MLQEGSVCAFGGRLALEKLRNKAKTYILSKEEKIPMDMLRTNSRNLHTKSLKTQIRHYKGPLYQSTSPSTLSVLPAFSYLTNEFTLISRPNGQ